MRKLVAALLAVLVAGAVFANGAKEQSAAAAAAAAKKTVTIWCYWETVKHQEALAQICKDYNATQDKVEVVVKYVPFADFKKQLSIGAVASELPEIVIIDNPDHASYSAMGIFADITDKVASWPGLNQYYEGPLNSCKLNGRLYGIPFGSNCLSLYYNEDMLKAAGSVPPKTWEELKDVALKTTKGNVKGFGISSLQNEEGTFGFLCWLWSTGNSSFQINNAGGIKALSLMRDLAKSGAMPKEVINWTQGDTMNQFISGNLAMMVNGPWQVPTMRAQAPNLKWNVVQLPIDKIPASDLGGENFGVIKGDKVAEAVDFIKFATDPARIKTYINLFGYISSRKDVAATQFTDDPIMQVFAAQMASAQPRGPHARWPEISDALSLAMNESLIGIATPEAAAAKAQATIDAVLKK